MAKPSGTSASIYFLEGCGRCPLGGTPSCKIHPWSTILLALRPILQESGLTEERKWGMPCYTFQGKNVAMLTAFKNYVSVSFFKGALLSDPQGVLQKPGDNSQAARLLRFISPEDVVNFSGLLSDFLQQSIQLEKSGARIRFDQKNSLELTEEFRQKMEEVPGLKEAFDALTPGRQRAYHLHFASAKQVATRLSRIEKWIPAILEGKGFMEERRPTKSTLTKS